MNLLWDQEPVVAPSDFSPFSHEVALPVRVSDASAQARAPLTPAAGTRPRRRSLLEIGLAHGDGADELEAKARTVDAARRHHDRAVGAEQDGAGGEAVGEENDVPAEAPSATAISAIAEDIRATQAATAQLSGELADLKAKEAELHRRLIAMLISDGEAEAARHRPVASPAAELPTLKWPRED